MLGSTPRLRGGPHVADRECNSAGQVGLLLGPFCQYLSLHEQMFSCRCCTSLQRALAFQRTHSEGCAGTFSETHQELYWQSAAGDCQELHNASAICRGREAEVPHMVVGALRRTELRSCRRNSRHAQKALAMIRVREASHFPRVTHMRCCAWSWRGLAMLLNRAWLSQRYTVGLWRENAMLRYRSSGLCQDGLMRTPGKGL